jgi:hypothetical protein
MAQANHPVNPLDQAISGKKNRVFTKPLRQDPARDAGWFADARGIGFLAAAFVDVDQLAQHI